MSQSSCAKMPHGECSNNNDDGDCGVPTYNGQPAVSVYDNNYGNATNPKPTSTSTSTLDSKPAAKAMNPDSNNDDDKESDEDYPMDLENRRRSLENQTTTIPLVEKRRNPKLPSKRFLLNFNSKPHQMEQMRQLLLEKQKRKSLPMSMETTSNKRSKIAEKENTPIQKQKETTAATTDTTAATAATTVVTAATTETAETTAATSTTTPQESSTNSSPTNPFSNKELNNSRHHWNKNPGEVYNDPQLQKDFKTLEVHEKNERILEKNISTLTKQIKVLQKQLNEQKASLVKTRKEKGIVMESITEQELKLPCRWNAVYYDLKMYKEKHGHINLPTRCPEDPKLDRLCIWLNKQKQHYSDFTKKGKFKTYYPLRFKALMALGIQWTVRDDKWQKNLEKLKEFKKKHGHTKVPTKRYEDQHFANWVATQRYDYKLRQDNKKSSMTEERIKILKDVGFVFNVFDEQWDKMFDILVEVKNQSGDVNVPELYPNPSLKKWVERQQMEYELFMTGKKDSKKCRINQVKIDKLINLGFVFRDIEIEENEEVVVEKRGDIEENEKKQVDMEYL